MGLGVKGLMPFTTSHPAIILPLKQVWPRWFSLTGLMAGAMSPDLIYFLMATTRYHWVSHSWRGLFLFCFPAGIAFAFAFHRLFKYQAIVNLPNPLDRFLSGLAVSEFRVAGRSGWIVFVLSVLIGGLSHLFWDSCTHAAGLTVRLIPFLSRQFTMFGFVWCNYEAAQHISSIVGGIAMILFFFRSRLIPRPVQTLPSRSRGEKIRFWLVTGTAASIFAAIVLVFFNYWRGWHIETGANIRPALKTLGLAGWAGFFYAISLFGLTGSSRARRRHEAEVAAGDHPGQTHQPSRRIP